MGWAPRVDLVHGFAGDAVFEDVMPDVTGEAAFMVLAKVVRFLPESDDVTPD